MKLFSTYGCGSNLRNCYAVVEGENYKECCVHAGLITEGKLAELIRKAGVEVTIFKAVE